MFSLSSIGAEAKSFTSVSSIGEIVEKLVGTNDQRLDFEKKMQLALNRGEIPTALELKQLHDLGYSISHNPSTIARFSSFTFPDDVDYTEAIQSATATKGLLIDGFKMYRPGPASAKEFQGAAKGYDEIFAIFEEHTTEKARIGKDTSHVIDLIIENLPPDHLWNNSITLCDLGCGNGVQIQKVIQAKHWKIIGIDNQAACIEKCRALLPEYQFEVHNLFDRIPAHLEGKANVIFVSHVYCRPEKVSTFIQNIEELQASPDTLLIFVNGRKGSDADRLCEELPFLRGKPSSNMSNDLKEALDKAEYRFTEFSRYAKINFPDLTPCIRDFLLSIKRGDYENPYANIDPDIRIFKGLMEFIASFPLESMTREQIVQYLDAIDTTFKKNGGPFLNICNQFVLAHPNKASKLFISAFKNIQKPQDFDYQIELIRDTIELRYFEEAKSALGSLLKEHRENKERSIIAFELLSDTYLQCHQYPEAASILWYAKRLGAPHLAQKIEAVEQALLQRVSGKPNSYGRKTGSLKGLTQAQADQEKLSRLRERVRKNYHLFQNEPLSISKAEKMCGLYKVITYEIKQYVHELISDIIEQLRTWGQEIPCNDFAIIGLGSLSREEMTPYSDFEFAILIDSELEEVKQYFRFLTLLLNLRIINLGETILPSLGIHHLDWLYDDITPRGLSFDGSMTTACKTPIGKQQQQAGDYELIHTPLAMSRLQHIPETDKQKQIWVLKRYHLPTILSSVTYVTGSAHGSELVSQYENHVQEMLETGLGKERAFHLMEDDLLHFKPRMEKENNGKYYNVKKDLYRLPNTMFDALANFFLLRSKSSWDRIAELEKKGKIEFEGAQNLRLFVMAAQELRLASYLNHERQKELLDLETHKDIIYELYYRSLPFTKAMEEFCLKIKNGENPEPCLQTCSFYERSPFNIGLIHLRHMKFLDAEKSFEEQMIDSPEFDESYADLETILGKYQKAETAYLRALKKGPSARLYRRLGEVRQLLGRYRGESSAEEAYHLALNMLKYKSDEIVIEDTYRTLIKFYLEIGDFEQCRHYLQLCTGLAYKRTANKEKDPEYQVVIDLGLAETKMVTAEVIDQLDCQYDRSNELFQSARAIYRGYYRRDDHLTALNCDCQLVRLSPLNKLEAETHKVEVQKRVFGEKHPDVARSYNALGLTLGWCERISEAEELIKRAQEMQQELFGDEHVEVASCYNNLGLILRLSQRYEEALEIDQNALKLRIKLLGNKHPLTAVSYNNLALDYQSLSRYEESKAMHEKALSLRQELFGEMHPDIANSLNNLAYFFGQLGDIQEKRKLLEKVLKIEQQLYGEKHPYLASSYHNLGEVLIQQGCLTDALKMQMIGLMLLKKHIGEYNLSIVTDYRQIGEIYILKSNHSLAIEFGKKALNILRRLSLRDQMSNEACKVHYMLTLAYSALKDLKSAEEHSEKATEIGRVLAIQSLHKKISNQFNTFLRKKQYKKALQLIDEHSNDFKKILDCYYLCYQIQLTILLNEKNITKFEKIIKKAEQIAQNQQESLDDRCKLMLCLAFYNMQKKKWNQALRYALQVSEVSPTLTFIYELLDIHFLRENEELLGDTIPLHLLGSFLVFQIYQNQGNENQAKVAAEQLLSIIAKSMQKCRKVTEIEICCKKYLSKL